MDVDTHGEHLVYLYCVTAQPPNLEGIDARPGELYLVCEAGLYAVARQVEAAEFGQSNLQYEIEDLAWLAARTTEHERIVETIMRDRCVIPFRFAMLFSDDESLKAGLRTHCGQFKTLLEQLDGKSEWGVKLYCDSEKLKHSIVRSDLDEAIGSACPGRAFLLKKKRDDLAKAALAKTMDQVAERTVEVLEPISFQTRINKVLPAAAEKPGDMILNSAFLIGNNDVETFMGALNALSARYAPEGVFVEHTGPWPPYNFCDLAMEATNE
jgi:hypothetical protein